MYRNRSDGHRTAPVRPMLFKNTSDRDYEGSESYTAEGTNPEAGRLVGVGLVATVEGQEPPAGVTELRGRPVVSSNKRFGAGVKRI